MWDTSSAYPKDILDFVPSVCTEAPVSGKAFCYKHAKQAEDQGKPSNLSEFISTCGADPNALTKEGKGKMKEVLKKMAEKTGVKEEIKDEQIGYLLRNRDLANKENFTSEKTNEDDCRKDLGEKTVHKLSKSRGGLFSISGGGVIRSWSTLYKSEGATQGGVPKEF